MRMRHSHSRSLSSTRSRPPVPRPPHPLSRLPFPSLRVSFSCSIFSTCLRAREFLGRRGGGGAIASAAFSVVAARLPVPCLCGFWFLPFVCSCSLCAMQLRGWSLGCGMVERT